MADNYIEKQFESYQARKAAWEKENKYKRKKPAARTEPVNHPCERLFHNHSKKVVAIHDLSGVGRVSLMAVIPILSSMGGAGMPASYGYSFQSYSISYLFFS